jgi:hypothetical protein
MPARRRAVANLDSDVAEQEVDEPHQLAEPGTPGALEALFVDVDLGHELDSGLAMGGGTGAMVLPGHIVVSDKIAPTGTSGAVEHGAARGN